MLCRQVSDGVLRMDVGHRPMSCMHTFLSDINNTLCTVGRPNRVKNNMISYKTYCKMHQRYRQPLLGYVVIA